MKHGKAKNGVNMASADMKAKMKEELMAAKAAASRKS